MDLAGNVTGAVVLKEVVLKQFVQLRNDVALALGRADLRDVFRVDFRSRGWVLTKEVGQLVDGAALVGDKQLGLRHLRNARTRLLVVDQLLWQEHHAIHLTESNRQFCQELGR